MTDVIIVLAVVAGIIWLGLMLVSALRNRGGEEEVAPNLKPGIDDQQLETRRLERGQKAAIAFSAFLAISIPLYFLGEPVRQEGFTEEFSEGQIERGEHIVEEFGCFQCHGPLGAGGSAQFVEKRSGVSVSWTAPSLDDVLYRYDPDELTFWITYGRGNTPMPAWGVAGGGPMSPKQIDDVVAYLISIQKKQQQAVDETPDAIKEQIARLDNADVTVATAIVNQSQVVAEIDQAEDDAKVIQPLAERARKALDGAAVGIDTDADGLSDAAEAELVSISKEATAYFTVFDQVTLDPETPDAELVDEALDKLETLSETDPIFQLTIADVRAALDEDVISEDSPDTDGDGISDSTEGRLSGVFTEASASTVPDSISVINLDPTNPETASGVPDRQTANTMVGGLETVSINLGVTVENEDRIRPQQQAGLDFLKMAQEQAAWEIDIAGVAAAMGGSEEKAQRAVGLFNTNCARCHTAGFSAGVPYTLEAGSGGFGPALWNGRELIQFGPKPDDPEETDLLVDFITKGSEAQKPYGLNGFGSGRMPAFGEILSSDDIELLARYLRSGNLDGKE
ncbi:MAG TPA: c-type cytochrome [Acidimicrobiia bacterium]|jgi:mono/diheme cytochrome c family protein|nr:c-type cytochrome [Acidimicrobiia bacterium]